MDITVNGIEMRRFEDEIVGKKYKTNILYKFFIAQSNWFL